MAVKVAINGFGRIGRLVLRALIEAKRDDVTVVAINDLGTVEANAHLLSYDSVHGRLPAKVVTGPGWMEVDGHRIAVIAERDPSKLPWAEHGVDVAFECTGIFTKRETAGHHLTAGAKRVLISAPGDNADLTVVMGVNDHEVTAEHKVLSNASCTTNALAPIAFVLHEKIGIERGYMTTIHSYTGDQPTVDTLHKDLRRARGAALSMIPTSTGAAKAVGLVLPALKGKLDGTSIRVPTPDVSVIDLTFTALKDTSVAEINDAVSAAAEMPRFKGILGVNDAPLVSADFVHDAHSSVFDLTQTVVLEKRFVRVMSWYDNEWGFSNRMLDVAAVIGKTL